MITHLNLPELDLSKNEKDILANFYNQNKNMLKANNHSGLNFLLFDSAPSCLVDIVNKINPDYFNLIYFYSSWSSVKPHTDKRRSVIISIPIINENNIPAIFHNDKVHYHNAVMFNTQQEHWVINENNSFRLFVQIELSHDLTMKDCIDLYNKGLLINENYHRNT